MISDFKKRLFCQLSGTPQRDVDGNDDLWVERINSFLSSRSVLPRPNDPTEYAAAFEAVYPTPEDRRKYIEDAIRRGTPSFAHRVLASLLTTGRVPCVFTTNFDPLVETATTLTDQLLDALDRAYLTVAALDSVERAELCVRESRWPLLAKLHGDFQSVDLKNTSDELKAQDAKMRRVLTTVCARFGLIVVGYSGRDASVMEALTDSLAQPNVFPGGIYWMTQSASSASPAVTKFLSAALEADISVNLVQSQTFDELAADIADGTDFPDALKKHIFAARPAPILRSVPIPTRERRKFPILQCSAIPILSMPSSARRINVSRPVTNSKIRELLREAKVWALAASNGKEVAAYGPDAGLLRAFAPVGGQLSGTIRLRPDEESWALGLLYDALTRAVCRDRPLFARLRHAGHCVLVADRPRNVNDKAAAFHNGQLAQLRQAYSAALFGVVPVHGYPFHEGVRLRLEHNTGKWWCVFEPTTYVDVPRSEESEIVLEDASSASSHASFRRGDPVIDWRRERWATRYNNVWARILSAWATMLAGEEDGVVRAIGVANGGGVDAEFRLSHITAWSRPGLEHAYFRR